MMRVSAAGWVSPRELKARLDRARAAGAYERFVDRTDNWMLALAIVFLVVLVWPLIDPDLPPPLETVLNWADVVIWVIFVVEYQIRLALAPDRWRFVRTHIPDLIVVLIPPLRGLRVLVVLRLLRLLGLVSMAGRLSRQSLQVRTGTYTAILALGVLFAGAATVTEVERGAPEANITSFGDALWWALTTMTTVGYGDRFPVTPEGRLVAAALMLAGIAVLGVLTASIAAWFLSQFRAVEETVTEAVGEVEQSVEEVEQSVEEVEQSVEEVEQSVEEVEQSVADIGEAVDEVAESVQGGEDREVMAALRDISTRLATLERAVARVSERDGSR